MSLPDSCRRLTKEERTITSKSLAAQDIREPFFAVYDDSFLALLGSNPAIKLVLEEDYKFAHEAPVYVPKQDAVYFTSNVLRTDPPEPHIIISKASRQQDGTWTREEIETNVSMGNGGINYEGGALFCAQGTKSEPGGIVWMETEPPYATKTLIDGFHGRLFNSVNDLVTHTDGSIWFTDPTYGFDQGFRNKPQLPLQVYRFEPESGDIRVVADGFGRPNGLCFSPDEKTVYITDTDLIHGDGTIDFSKPGTIYAFDMIDRHGSHFLANRRLFALADCEVPDGIKCNMEGNVYSGCGDGVVVWSPGGKLIGKIFIPGGVANFCFTKKGEIMALNEKRVYVATFGSQVQGALLANLGIDV